MSEVLKGMARRRAEGKEQIALGITAGSSLPLRGGVITLVVHLLLFLVSMGGVKPAFAQSASASPSVMLQAGIEEEDVDGDLDLASAVYQKIAADASAPRDVRAKALLRLAGCDEKLGKQARQVYE